MRVLSVAIAVLAAWSTPSSVHGVKDIPIEYFGDNPIHSWFSVNDPVMGGQSTGTATVENGVGVFKGEVKVVPSLGVPGFIAMQTAGGYYPDLSSCSGLRLTVKSANDYAGFRVSFGTAHPEGGMNFPMGYKANFKPDKVGVLSRVSVSFSDFSDNWDPKSGDQVVTCYENVKFCPDETTLKNLLRFQIMAEGVAGEVDLEVHMIEAVNCADTVVVESNPLETNPQGGRGQGQGSGGGRGNGNGEGFRGRGNTVTQNGTKIGYVIPSILPNDDIRIESFSNPQHSWFAMNDPVMGGSSTSTVSLKEDTGVFVGEVVDVSFLNAPGFIKMETRGGAFPDVSHCNALKINLKAPLDYDGLRMTFGVHHAEGAEPYVRGYKAPLNVQRRDTFQDVVIPFTDFSDSWDPKTGDIVVPCSADSTHCPDDATLRYMTTMSIMGEGVDGKVYVVVKSIDATDCAKLTVAGMQMSNAVGASQSFNWTIVGIAVGVVAVALIGGFFIGRFTSRRRNKKAQGNVELESIPASNDMI